MSAPSPPPRPLPGSNRPRNPRWRPLLLPYLNLLWFLGPALALAALEGELLLGGIVAFVGAALAAGFGWERAGELAWVRLPAAIAAVAGPVVLAPGGLLEVLFAAASGFGVLAWITTISGAPMGPGRRRAGLLGPLAGILCAVALALAAPGLSAGPGFAALLVVLAILVAALGLQAGPEPEPSEVRDFEDPTPAPTP
ncbi:MAG TPA: hypothetical protein VMH90_03355 [Thermoplasmata archaeon]|nr:hypothetical protein [Thermoplasmata archaeon]